MKVQRLIRILGSRTQTMLLEALDRAHKEASTLLTEDKIEIQLRTKLRKEIQEALDAVTKGEPSEAWEKLDDHIDSNLGIERQVKDIDVIPTASPTGRMSSQEPNLQSVKRESELSRLGEAMDQAFITMIKREMPALASVDGIDEALSFLLKKVRGDSVDKARQEITPSDLLKSLQSGTSPRVDGGRIEQDFKAFSMEEKDLDPILERVRKGERVEFLNKGVVVLPSIMERAMGSTITLTSESLSIDGKELYGHATR